MVVEVSYCLSKTGQKAALAANQNAAYNQVAKIEDPENSLLDLVSVKHDGTPTIDLRFIVRSLKVDMSQLFEHSVAIYRLTGEFNSYGDKYEMDALLTTPGSVRQAWDAYHAGQQALLDSIPERQAEFDADFEVRKAAYLEQKAANQQRDAEREAQRQAEQEARESAAAAREAVRTEWVQTHGSDYLRKAIEGGYDCQRVYVTERAALEYPGYAVDYSNDAAWKSRSCPSETALEEALRVDGTVVWLTEPGETIREELMLGDRDEDAPEFEAQEAVHVRFLDRYDLLKLID